MYTRKWTLYEGCNKYFKKKIVKEMKEQRDRS